MFINMLQSINPTFLIIIVTIFVMLIVCAAKWKNDRAILINLLPQIGVAGTFIGAVYSLFIVGNTTNLMGNIGEVMTGIAISFISSIVGQFLSVFIQLIHKNDNGYDDVSLGTIAEILTENTLHLININQSLSDNEKSPILNELQKLRLSLVDKNDELITEFKTFAETQAENNANSLIEALEEVMREFNVKISEQFGDNFKRLNEAVGKMLEWQEKYYKQIEFITNQLDDNANLMEKNREIITDVSAKYTDGLELSSKMETSIDNMEMQRKALETNMEKFTELSDEAKKVFPVIEENINNLTEGFSGSVTNSMENIENLVSTQKEQVEGNIDKLNEIYENSMQNVTTQFSGVIEESLGIINNTVGTQSEKIDDNITKLNEIYETSMQNITTQFSDVVEESLGVINTTVNTQSEQIDENLTKLNDIYEESITNLTEQFSSVVKDSLDNIQNVIGSQGTQLDDNMNKLNEIYQNSINSLHSMQESMIENTKDQIQLIDKGLEKELNDSLNSLGQHLTALSNKFVDDYQPLTEKLSKVVKMSEGIVSA